MTDDTRIAYGVLCPWWDAVGKAKNAGIPVCPYCEKPLYEMSESLWKDRMTAFNRARPGYTELMTWMRGKCFRSFMIAEEKYHRHRREDGGEH